jgi:hypothetical protein
VPRPILQFSDFKGYEGIRDALLAGCPRLGLDHLSLLMQVGQPWPVGMHAGIPGRVVGTT